MKRGSTIKILLIVGAIVIVGVIAFLFTFGGLKINGYARLNSSSVYTPSEITGEYATYKSAKYGYTFMYPKTWNTVSNPGHGFDVLVSNALEGNSFAGMQTFSDAKSLDYQLEYEKTSLNSSFVDLRLGVAQKTTINGYSAYKLPYTYKDPASANDFKGMVVLVSNGVSVYGLNFRGGAEVFNRYSNTITNSLKPK